MPPPLDGGEQRSAPTYNALGQRVEELTGTSTTGEAYGAEGELLMRYTGYSSSRSFVPFGGACWRSIIAAG